HTAEGLAQRYVVLGIAVLVTKNRLVEVLETVVQVQCDVVAQIETVVQRVVQRVANPGEEVVGVVDGARQRAVAQYAVNFNEVITALSWVIVVQHAHVVAYFFGQAASETGVVVDLDAVIESDAGSPGADVEPRLVSVVEATLNSRTTAGL